MTKIDYSTFHPDEIREIRRATEYLQRAGFIVRTPETAGVPFNFIFLAKDSDSKGFPPQAEVRIEVKISGVTTTARQSIPDEFLGDPGYYAEASKHLAHLLAEEVRADLIPRIDRVMALHLPLKQRSK